MRHLRLLPILATACFLLAGCDPQTTPITPEPDRVPETETPAPVQIGEHELTLETYLWRDFMPFAPPDGQPLIAVLKVRTVNGSALPAGVRADSVSITHLSEVWKAPVRLEYPSQVPSVLEVAARNGPKWEPGGNVDVVLHLRDGTGRAIRLLAANQPIRRTS